MTARLPINFRWDGESMVPATKREAKACDDQYVVGEQYRLADWEDRSITSHNHEFAWLHEAWQSLPETLADQYPSAEHLRKRALIQAGFYDEQVIDCGSNAAALRVAAAIRQRHEFSLVIVRGAFVFIRDAKSQSRRAMNKEEFQASKSAILEIIAELIGVNPQQLRKEAGKAA